MWSSAWRMAPQGMASASVTESSNTDKARLPLAEAAWLGVGSSEGECDSASAAPGPGVKQRQAAACAARWKDWVAWVMAGGAEGDERREGGGERGEVAGVGDAL